MSEKLAAYRKAAAALVGVGFIVASQLGLAVEADLEPAVVAAIDAVLGALTVAGVFAVKNEPKEVPYSKG